MRVEKVKCHLWMYGLVAKLSELLKGGVRLGEGQREKECWYSRGGRKGPNQSRALLNMWGNWWDIIMWLAG